MQLSEKQILEKLPDYEDFMGLTEEIENISFEKTKLDITIKTLEVEIVRKVTTLPEYFQAGKVPSMSFIESTYKYAGINGELVPMRTKLAELTSLLEKLKMQMDVFNTFVDIWRTLSSNSRKANL